MTFKKKSKYGNIKMTVDGITFDSKAEAGKYLQYKEMLRLGKIRDLVLQEKFSFVINGAPVVIRSARYPNGRTTSYRADFSFWDNTEGRKRIIDVKGVQTDLFKLKRALVEAIHGVHVEIVA